MLAGRIPGFNFYHDHASFFLEYYPTRYKLVLEIPGVPLAVPVTNSTLTGDSPDECDGNACPTNGSNGNVVAQNPTTPILALLGNYGGPTQTMLPLPGSPAICAGSSWLVPAGLTTDQRGLPRINTTYSSNPCVDAGAVQTNYQSVQFTNVPGAGNYNGSINQAISPAPIVSVTENGQNIGGVPVTLSFSGSGTANGLGPVTTAAGTGATFSNLTVNAGGNDTLSATLNITSSNSVSITTGTVALNIGSPATTTTVSATPNSPRTDSR